VTAYRGGDRVRILDPRLARPNALAEVLGICTEHPRGPRIVVQWTETLHRGCTACFAASDLESVPGRSIG